MKKISTAYLLFSTLLVGTLLLWLSKDMHTLDSRLSYSLYEAVAFFADLNEENKQKLRWICAIDFLLFIPVYALMLARLTLESGKARLFQISFLSIGIAADCSETIFEFLGTHGIGLQSGWLPQALAISTPTKWIALLLWGLVFLLSRRLR